MKKLFILTLVLMMTFMGSVSASKSKFKDPNYNFSNIMNLYLAECVYTPKSNHPHDLQEDSNPTGRALNSLRTALAKKNKNLIIPPEEPTRARLDLLLAVHTLATYTYWKEPWVEEIYENKKIVEKGRDGRERSITIPVKRLIQHPGEWITNAYAEVEFTLKDRNTGHTVYNCIDTRERQDSGYDGMLNRICNDFVNDLK
ncbi:hypothetical protein [Succiniclasticum ruminis]|uniref:Uncharacterized protein n=1 Tax=Succiniclasticum ruminis DSM 9236 TaxID=1123323 RepID=A0A1I1YVD6_9FIRM|nr:hypothetical protein [Succiniclasticum ruminis]SFE23526.1 hypothetical protein SAMN05216245_10326 [Succiniclasticum ruminis DSM 9236]